MACSPAASAPGSKVATISTPFGVSVRSTVPAALPPVPTIGAEAFD
jgi:hypothetical protein